MSVSAYIFCVIGVTVASSWLMKLILWLDQPKVKKQNQSQAVSESC